MLPAPTPRPGPPMMRNRAFYANSFCGGRGIEIGALLHPTPLPAGAKVRYVDRMSVVDLRLQYKELDGVDLVPVDIVDSGETLASLPDGQEDFVIAGQFIEHCQNPVRAIVNMLRVARNGGFIFLIVPDMRMTRDKSRQLTSNEHLLDECIRGTEHTRRGHFIEFARDSEGISDPAEIEKRADWLMSVDYSIHYHVWDSDSFLGFLLWAKGRFKLPFEIQATCRNGDELIVILQKSVS